MAILVIGSIGLDTIETPFSEGPKTDILGGSASYFALAASYFDRVNLVAVVGDDFPSALVEVYRARQIDLAGLQTEPGKTFRWGGRYHLDYNTRDTLFTDLGVFGAFAPVVPNAYHSSEILFLANLQPHIQSSVSDQLGSAPRLRALDTMNHWIASARDELTEAIRRVDVVLIAEEEARQFAETPSLRAAARFIIGLGPRSLVIKQGSYGALLFTADGAFFSAPAYPLEEVRDPTGAGDSFAGGFLGHLGRRLAEGASLTLADYRRALVYGAIMGSFACEDFGVERLRRLTPDEIAARYREFVTFTHFESDW
ncbi:MAG TPA: PfkB family carbohydrate kinase [Ktedonobacterales bacterium]|nr:PfkB family carbohydrate kinase [Ktedonobacterales bacterium]